MKRILTWLQVTSDQFHVGNYFWAVKPMIDLANENPEAEMFLFVANMHSLTTVKDGSLRQNAFNTLKLYIAAGVDPERFFIYNQADVPGHAQLTRVLSCLTHMWFMERMHAYKDKSWKINPKEIWVGLFTYPILMAADIILYDATHVPTGKDQKQHVEYARDIAGKFNKMYGETFVLPEPIIQQSVATVPWIDGRKMSKSYNNYIGLLDADDIIVKKVKKIPTAPIPIEESKDPDECNVYNIFKLFLDEKQDATLRKRYTDWWLSYKVVKDELSEKLISFIAPIREKAQSISDQEIIDLLKKSSGKAQSISKAKIEDVYNKVWFSL